VKRTAFAKRNADQVALGFFRRLANGFRNLTGLAFAEAGTALLVSDHHEGCKTEVLAAFHGFRDAVDTNQLVNELGGFIVTVARILTITTTAPLLASFLSHQANSFRI